MSQVDILAF